VAKGINSVSRKLKECIQTKKLSEDVVNIKVQQETEETRKERDGKRDERERADRERYTCIPPRVCT
jgi:hypothetical protein